MFCGPTQSLRIKYNPAVLHWLRCGGYTLTTGTQGGGAGSNRSGKVLWPSASMRHPKVGRPPPYTVDSPIIAALRGSGPPGARVQMGGRPVVPAKRRHHRLHPMGRPRAGRGSLGGGCDPRPGGRNTTKKLTKHSPLARDTPPVRPLASRSTPADVIPISGVRGISSPVRASLRSAVLIRCGVLRSLTPLPPLLLSSG